MTDSIRRDDITIGRTPAAPAPVKRRRNVKRCQIAYTTADGTRRTSVKLYRRAIAFKLVSRLNRKAYADAYAAIVHVLA